jgi:hypothetical protein
MGESAGRSNGLHVFNTPVAFDGFFSYDTQASSVDGLYHTNSVFCWLDIEAEVFNFTPLLNR